MCVCHCTGDWQRRAGESEPSWLLADIDPCGRLCPHNDIFWGSPALNRTGTVGAEPAVAMQQFVAGSIQVGPEWRAAARRRRRWFECVQQGFCSFLVGELSLHQIVWKLNKWHRATAAAEWGTVELYHTGAGCKYRETDQSGSCKQI